MTRHRKYEEGYLLVGLLVVVFIILLTLSVAAPSMIRSLRRDKEIESVHRAQEYQRAIQVYYRKLGHYPGSIEQLDSTNNMRFLRQHYVDPLTGKDDWRLIHMGEAKSTLKGFFGQPLGPTGGGLGSASGMSSGIGGTQNTGQSGALGASGTAGATGSTGFGGGLGSLNRSGGGGIIVGVGSSKTGSSLVAVNGDETNYEDWEFVYDPRIDQMKAQVSLLGGSPASTPASNFGSGFPGSTGSSGSTGATGTTR